MLYRDSITKRNYDNSSNVWDGQSVTDMSVALFNAMIKWQHEWCYMKIHVLLSSNMNGVDFFLFVKYYMFTVRNFSSRVQLKISLVHPCVFPIIMIDWSYFCYDINFFLKSRPKNHIIVSVKLPQCSNILWNRNRERICHGNLI